MSAVDIVLILGVGLFVLTQLKSNTTSATVSPTPAKPVTPATAAGGNIYPSGGKGRVITTEKTSGKNCESDGIRFNLVNQRDLVNREVTWIITQTKGPEGCTSALYYELKVGSHGSTGVTSAQYDMKVQFDGKSKGIWSEGPHPKYYKCTGGTANSIPPMPLGKPIGFKFVSWRIAGNGIHAEWWYDFTGGGNGPYHRFASIDDHAPGQCHVPGGPIGGNGSIIGPAPLEDTLRLNGASANWIRGSIREITVPTAAKSGLAEVF
jgi:hypothetical protein